MTTPRMFNRLANTMFAAAIRLEWTQRAIRSSLSPVGTRPIERMPRLLVLPNVRGWAFDDLSQGRARHMQSTWCTELQYVDENPAIDSTRYDLMFDPNWGYSAYDAAFHGRYVRGIFSHKWQCTASPYRALHQSLRGAVACFVPNRILHGTIGRIFPATFLVREGIDTATFRWLCDRTGSDLVVGWTGNPKSLWKRLDSVVKPACAQAGVELRIASTLAREDLARFYNNVDLVLVASEPLEGNPLAVLEAGACGRAVLATNVGCVPELVENQATGLVVESTFDIDRTVQAFVDHLLWCKEHVAEVRAMGKEHRERVLAERTLEKTCETFRKAIEWAYAHRAFDPT